MNKISRALRALFGADDIHGPAKRPLTAMDVSVQNGMFIIGDRTATPDDAYRIALEILKRLK